MYTKKNAQSGVVSFLVTLIMMLVISLVVIGFTQVTNRTQREALDRQLATQAQYAAESGVNKVGAILDNTSIVATKTKTTCDNSGAYSAANFDPTINATDSVSVTCVLVDTRPADIRVNANQTSSTIVPINVVDSSGTARTAQSLTFTWSGTESSPNVSQCNMIFASGLPKTIGDCKFALLRVDLVRGNAPTDPDGLMAATTSFYMKPTAGGGALTIDGSTPKGSVISAKCTTTCTVTLTLKAPWNIGNFYARLSTMYLDAPVVMIDAGISTPNDAYFEGAQAAVDSTGKAQDVLKRIQVRYPIGIRHDDTIPPYALQSESSICKKFTNVGTAINNDGACQ